MIEENVETKVETKVEKWSRECFAQGFKFIGKSSENSNYAIAECMTCGHVDSYQQTHMRTGKVACSNCLTEKWTRECLAQGFKFIEKVDGYNTLAECMTCGYQDVYRHGNMRTGKVACSNCLIDKWSIECFAQGFKFIEKVGRDISLCECLECGHQDVYYQSTMRKGQVACSNCSPGHWNEPSYFYIVRIKPANHEPIIKIGVSNNPVQRYKNYGLESSELLDELFTQQFETKLEAVQFESLIKRILEPYHIDPEEARKLLPKSGWTECFFEHSLDCLVTVLGTVLKK